MLNKKQNIDELESKIHRMDTDLDELESMFYQQVETRNVQLENIEDEDLEKHCDLFEFSELQRLEKQISAIEEHKVNLIKKERYTQAELMKESSKIGLEVDALEQKNDFKSKEREREITKLYAKMSNKFRQIINMADGSIRISQRKIKKFLEPERKKKMLFDGIRDQKLDVKW